MAGYSSKPACCTEGCVSGQVAEWLKAHAWKACIRSKRIGGSNPPLSANYALKSFIHAGFKKQPYFSPRFTPRRDFGGLVFDAVT